MNPKIRQNDYALLWTFCKVLLYTWLAVLKQCCSYIYPGLYDFFEPLNWSLFPYWIDIMLISTYHRLLVHIPPRKFEVYDCIHNSRIFLQYIFELDIHRCGIYLIFRKNQDTI